MEFPRLFLGLHPANERRCYKVTPSLIGWAQMRNYALLFSFCSSSHFHTNLAGSSCSVPMCRRDPFPVPEQMSYTGRSRCHWIVLYASWSGRAEGSAAALKKGQHINKCTWWLGWLDCKEIILKILIKNKIQIKTSSATGCHMTSGTINENWRPKIRHIKHDNEQFEGISIKVIIGLWSNRQIWW